MKNNPKTQSTSTKYAKSMKHKGVNTGSKTGSNAESGSTLTKLGNVPTAHPSKALEIFPNPKPQRDFLIHMQIPEFTCLCPVTGQPDFATLYLDYIPDQHCVELKSLKLYIWSFRNEGKFHEAVTNEILDDIVAAVKPRFAKLTAKFWVRGGIFTTVVTEHRKKGWKPSPIVDLQGFAEESSVTGKN